VAFANIFRGLPFDGQGYRGTLVSLLNPYGLAGGVLFLLLFVVHGAIWLSAKCDAELQREAAALAGRLWWVLLAVVVVFLAATWVDTPLYGNYLAMPLLWLVPLVAVLALVAVKRSLALRRYWLAWAASAATIVAVTFFGVIGLFPNLFPSRLAPESSSLTAFNSASTGKTLTIMLVVVLIFVPMVIAYQAWAYHLFRHRVSAASIDHEVGY
jgi:cytochrome d ubiquinol oxidase subunit II